MFSIMCLFLEIREMDSEERKEAERDRGIWREGREKYVKG